MKNFLQRVRVFFKKEISIKINIFLFIVVVSVLFGKYFFNPTFQCLFGNPSANTCNWQLWQIGEVFAVSAAAFIALWSGWKSNKNYQQQLKAEQEPFLILNKNIEISQGLNDDEKIISISLKNIGRGPATNITASFLENGRNEALFEKRQPHSINLGMNEESNIWEINPSNMKSQIKKQINSKDNHFNLIFNGLIKTEMYLYLFLFCNDQLNNPYVFQIKLGVEAIESIPIASISKGNSIEIKVNSFMLKTMEIRKMIVRE